jgi:hypothetical protein
MVQNMDKRPDSLDNMSGKIMGPFLSRLLILSCSERKRLDASPLPAIERYDGPCFRVARRFLVDGGSDLAVFVLSARFGLIAGSQAVPWYNERLSSNRQSTLGEQVGPQMQRLAANGCFRRAMICAGEDYMEVLDPFIPALRESVPVAFASGGMGEKLTRLRFWLDQPREIKATGPTRRLVSVRGVEIASTREEALAVAEDAARTGVRAATRCHGWCVPVASGRVAPKWLVRELTGLPLSRFHSDDARRALGVLGVEVLPCV